jgi:ribosomal protein S18 acetylase RimI-like enzyme
LWDCYPGGDSPFNLDLKINLSREDLDKVSMIDNIALLSKFRGSGLIKKALEQALKKAKNEGKTICLATVSENNLASKANVIKAGLEVFKTLEGMYLDENFPNGKTRLLLRRFL